MAGTSADQPQGRMAGLDATTGNDLTAAVSAPLHGWRSRQSHGCARTLPWCHHLSDSRHQSTANNWKRRVLWVFSSGQRRRYRFVPASPGWHQGRRATTSKRVKCWRNCWCNQVNFSNKDISSKIVTCWTCQTPGSHLAAPSVAIRRGRQPPLRPGYLWLPRCAGSLHRKPRRAGTRRGRIKTQYSHHLITGSLHAHHPSHRLLEIRPAHHAGVHRSHRRLASFVKNPGAKTLPGRNFISMFGP